MNTSKQFCFYPPQNEHYTVSDNKPDALMKTVLQSALCAHVFGLCKVTDLYSKDANMCVLTAD
jgi:hypothetical protein